MTLTMRDFECWTCLDFGDLPGLGPCPDCQPDAYTDHVISLFEHDHEEEVSR